MGAPAEAYRALQGLSYFLKTYTEAAVHAVASFYLFLSMTYAQMYKKDPGTAVSGPLSLCF